MNIKLKALLITLLILSALVAIVLIGIQYPTQTLYATTGLSAIALTGAIYSLVLHRLEDKR